MRLLSKACDRWTDLESRPLIERKLLRLELLRDLDKQLHAERSKSGSSSFGQEVAQIGLLQRALEALRILEGRDELLGRSRLTDTLAEVASADPHAAVPRSEDASLIGLEKELSAVLGEGRLDRADRLWEKALCEFGLRNGGTLRIHRRELPLAAVESAHQEIENEVPAQHGILLYLEGTLPSDSPLWHGKWVALFLPSADRDLPDWEIVFPANR